MNCTLFNGSPEHLNDNCLPPSFTLDEADGEFLPEPHLLMRSNTINHSLLLIHNVVCISKTPGGDFSLSNG